MAYPSQMQQLLDEDTDKTSGVYWQVINRGWPGRNSSELLQRLPGMLLRERPDYVCVLIGNNNRWSHGEMNLAPPQLRDASTQDDDQDWQWRWRTLRFLQLRYAAFVGRGGSFAPAESGSGSQQLERAESPSEREAADEASRSVPVDGINGELYAKLLSIKKLIRRGDLTGLTTVDRMLDEIRPQVRASADRAVAELLLEILEKLRRHQDVIDEGLLSIEKHGKSAGLCGRMVEPLARLGRLDEALSWADDAVRLQEPGHEVAWIYSARSLVHLRMHHYALSVDDSIRSFAIDPDAERLERALRKVLLRKKPSSLKRYVEAAEPPLTAQAQKRVNVLVRRVIAEAREEAGDETPLKRKLKDDLRNIIALVRESGAQPILLTYPNPGGGLHEVLRGLREIAAESGVPLVDIDPVFHELLRHERKERYFIADQHCNDAGYGIMAQQVAKVLRSVDASRP